MQWPKLRCLGLTLPACCGDTAMQPYCSLVDRLLAMRQNPLSLTASQHQHALDSSPLSICVSDRALVTDVCSRPSRS